MKTYPKVLLTTNQLVCLARNFYTYGWLDANGSESVADLPDKVSDWPTLLRRGRKQAAKDMRTAIKDNEINYVQDYVL